MKKNNIEKLKSDYSVPKSKSLPANVPIQKEESNTWMAIVAVVLLSIAGFVLFFVAEKPSSIIDVKTTTCIAKSSMLYATQWCGFCQKQKEMFGTNVDLLNMVDCDEDRQLCIDADISGFPTWIIDGKKYTGVKSEDSLKELTGC